MYCVLTLQEGGVTFTLKDAEYTFRGTVSLFPADNLASQFVGGYKALNAALRKCRQCLAVQEDMQLEVMQLTLLWVWALWVLNVDLGVHNMCIIHTCTGVHNMWCT